MCVRFGTIAMFGDVGRYGKIPSKFLMDFAYLPALPYTLIIFVPCLC